MSDISIKPDKDSLLEYIKRFQEGKIQVPAFQRNFVWRDNQKIELLKSIEKGYPIGSVLLWRPDFTQDEELYKFESETIGSYTIPSKNNDFFYILDGFQRLSTLFGCLINPHKTDLKRDKEKWKNEFNIVYNLEAEEGEYNFELSKREPAKLEYYKIPIYKLIDPKEFFSFQRKIFELELNSHIIESYLKKFENVSKAIQKYQLPSINIYGGTLSEAVDIFQRLNSRGTDMSPDWIVSALSFNKDKNFKLGAEIDNLLEEVAIYNFDKLKRSVVLNCITNSFDDSVYFDKASKRKNLEELARRDDFVDNSRSTISSIKKTINFLFENLLILSSSILPYNSQLIFITDFFNKLQNPTLTQLEVLKKWFWITTYSNYFTRYNLSKQRIAYDRFQAFIEDENKSPVYYDRGELFETLEFPDKINMGSVRAKALALFMLNHQVGKTVLNTDTLNGYKSYKIFKDEDNTSENTILIINDGNTPISKSKKDLSHWLDSYEDHAKFFITQKMKNNYKNGESAKSILEKRKELIIKEEKKFVESFSLEYTLESTPSQ